MRGKSKESHYLITKIFATDYFYFYSKPIIFFTYFFPYKISKNGESTTYQKGEFEKKRIDIKNEKFGKYGNYASQGFGNVVFYEPCINFKYFYNMLELYNKEKDNYFILKPDIIVDIEEDTMKEDIKYILEDSQLLLKKNVFVPKNVKQKLINHIKIHNNKYVLAELLFYIISENHCLPDIDKEKIESKKSKFKDIEKIFSPNIYMNKRINVDEKMDKLIDRLKDANEIQISAMNGNTLINEDEKGNSLLENLLIKKRQIGKGLNLEIIIEKSDSVAAIDAGRYKENFEHCYIKKSRLSKKTIDFLKKLSFKYSDVVKIYVKETKVILPYAMMIVKFNDIESNYVKIDLYSTYIKNKKDRPTFYLFENIQNELYNHFQIEYYSMWNDEESTDFLIGDCYD